MGFVEDDEYEMSDLSDDEHSDAGSETQDERGEVYEPPEFLQYSLPEEEVEEEVASEMYTPNLSTCQRRDMAARLEWACGHSLSPEARWLDALQPFFALYERVASSPSATIPLARSVAWRLSRLLEAIARPTAGQDRMVPFLFDFVGRAVLEFQGVCEKQAPHPANALSSTFAVILALETLLDLDAMPLPRSVRRRSVFSSYAATTPEASKTLVFDWAGNCFDVPSTSELVSDHHE